MDRSLPGSSCQWDFPGVPLCPSPGALPDPGIEPVFPALADGFFTAEPSGKALLERCLFLLCLLNFAFFLIAAHHPEVDSMIISCCVVPRNLP